MSLRRLGALSPRHWAIFLVFFVSLFPQWSFAYEIISPATVADRPTKADRCVASDRFKNTNEHIHLCTLRRTNLRQLKLDQQTAEKRLSTMMRRFSINAERCTDVDVRGIQQGALRCAGGLSVTAKRRVADTVDALILVESELEKELGELAQQENRFRTVRPEAVQFGNNCDNSICRNFPNGPSCSVCKEASLYLIWTDGLKRQNPTVIATARKEHRFLAAAVNTSLREVRESKYNALRTFADLGRNANELARTGASLASMQANGFKSGSIGETTHFVGQSETGVEYRVECGGSYGKGKCGVVGADESNTAYAMASEIENGLRENKSWLAVSAVPGFDELNIQPGLNLKGGMLIDIDEWASNPEDLIAALDTKVLPKKGILSEIKYWREVDVFNSVDQGMRRSHSELNRELDAIAATEEAVNFENGDSRTVAAANLIKNKAMSSDDAYRLQYALRNAVYDSEEKIKLGADGKPIIKDIPKLFVVDGDNGRRTKALAISALRDLPYEERQALLDQILPGTVRDEIRAPPVPRRKPEFVAEEFSHQVEKLVILPPPPVKPKRLVTLDPAPTVIVPSIGAGIVNSTVKAGDIETYLRTKGLSASVAATMSQDIATRGADSSYFLGRMRAESSFRPNVVSSAGAVGLNQIMPDTAQFLVQNGYNIPLQPGMNGKTPMSVRLRDPIYNTRMALAWETYMEKTYNFANNSIRSIAYICGANCAPQTMQAAAMYQDGTKEMARVLNHGDKRVKGSTGVTQEVQDYVFKLNVYQKNIEYFFNEQRLLALEEWRYDQQEE